VLMLGEHLLGATPFALASKFTEVDIMRTLAEAGADVRLPLKNCIILHLLEKLLHLQSY